jgi:hypothetical protein
MGRRYTLRVSGAEDMTRDVLKVCVDELPAVCACRVYFVFLLS